MMGIKNKKLTFIFITLSFICQTVISQSLPEKSIIIEKGNLVNSYWIKNNSQPGNNDWARSVYHTGNMYFYKYFPKNKYLQYSNLWAENHQWKLRRSNPDHADAQVCGQVYLDLYEIDKIKQYFKIAAIKEGIDKMVERPKIDDWWWVDAYYMAMPAFSQLGILHNDNRYFDKMYKLYYNTKTTLYNTTDHLWYRDNNVNHTTPNGKESYWSRGNGWAFAALARVLEILPVNNESRKEYIQTFREMAIALKNCQREDGFWNPSLVDPTDYGGPEASGTSLFLFGLAWGVNQGILDRDIYYSTIVKAWNGLSSLAIQPNGLLTYVQGVGFKPASNPATPNSTADFGVGVFLLACTETAKLASGDMPVASDFDITTLQVIDKKNIRLEFSMEIDDTSALSNSNYEISNGVIVECVEKINPKSLMLVTSEMLPGDYLLKVYNIKSQTGQIPDIGAWGSFEYLGIKSVQASDYQSGSINTPDKVIDTDMSTRWSSDGKGKWLLLDLGEERLLNAIRIAFYEGNTRKNYFRVESSLDNINFETVYQGESRGRSEQLENYDFSAKKAKYIKIIFNGNSKNNWNSVSEIRIKVVGLLSKVPTVNKSDFNIITNMQGRLVIQLNEENQKEFKLLITDMNGSSVYTKLFPEMTNRIIINNLWLPRGIYVCSITSNKKRMTQLFAVIQ